MFEDRGLWLAIGLRGLPETAVIALVSQYLAGESIPAWCDDDPVPLTGRLAEGCDFLQSGGYTAIRIVPAMLVLGFGLLAARRRRVGLVHIGFALALALVVMLIALPPYHYPV
jgi:hypothetical protein